MFFDDSWFYEVSLDWSAPVTVSYDFDRIPDWCFQEYGIYRLERSHHLQLGPRGIIRIGIAYDQSIGKRLDQYRGLLHEYRRNGEIRMSYAVPSINSRHTRRRYEDIEHLLIFATQPRENTMKRASVPRDAFYRIINCGHRGQLPRALAFPTIFLDHG